MEGAFNIDNNFWEAYPELQIAFGELYGNDKSKNKKTSSNTMWAYYLHCHPESFLYNIPNKRDLIAKDILKDAGFNWDDVENDLDLMTEAVLTEAEKALVSWNDTMRMRRRNLHTLYDQAFNEGDTDELVKLDKMMASTAKFFEDYRKIKKDYEEDKIKKKGTKIASLSDADEI